MRSIWRWAKRVTAFVAAIAVILLALRIYDAERGAKLMRRAACEHCVTLILSMRIE